MAGINSRAKGSAAERELAAAIQAHLGVSLVRNLEQSRSGGHDLAVHRDCHGPIADRLRRLAIEAKRYATVTPAMVSDWWSQAVQQGERAELVPVLAYRADRQVWRFVLPLAEVQPGMPSGMAIELTATLSVEGFAAVCRWGASDGEAIRLTIADQVGAISPASPGRF